MSYLISLTLSFSVYLAISYSLSLSLFLSLYIYPLPFYKKMWPYIGLAPSSVRPSIGTLVRRSVNDCL